MAGDSAPDFPFAREHGYDPSPLNDKLRHEAPVSKVKLYDGTEAYILMKHKDCCEALKSEKLSADRRTPGYPEIHGGGHKAKEANPTFVNLDDPDHHKQRMMLEDLFLPETVQKKYRPMMQKTVDGILDKMMKKGGEGKESVDLMEEFATPVPTQIIFKILGVPDEDIEEVSKDSEVRHSTSRNAAETSNDNLQKYMSELVEKRIKDPKDDLISKLVVEQLKPGNLTKDDITTLSFLVLTAGNAALLNSIGLGVLTLLQHPSQLSDFKKDPHGLATSVVNEITRYHTASALNSRRCTKPDAEVKLGGKSIPAKTGVICSVQSADRDEDKWGKDANEFNIHREINPKDILGFGYGPHRCQGEALSKTELEIAFVGLFERCPDLKLACKEEELEWSPAEQNVGVVKLPVRWW